MRKQLLISALIAVLATFCLFSAVCAEDESESLTVAQVVRSASTTTSSLQSDLESARSAMKSQDWSSAIVRYYNALTASENNQVAARECLQGLNECYAKQVDSTLSMPAMLDGFDIPTSDSGMVSGWTSYSFGPGLNETPGIERKLVHKARQIKNGRFGGVDPRTRVPLHWSSWGDGITYIDGSKHIIPYRGFVNIPTADAGIMQVAKNLVPGKEYTFGCFATEGTAIVGVDASGGTDPYSNSVDWNCTQSGFSLINDKDNETWWKRVSITFTATSSEATVLIKSATEGSVVVHQAYLDFCEMVQGDIDDTLIFAPANVYQEFDASAVIGTGDIGVPSDFVSGMYKQVSAGQEDGLLAVVRGFLNSPVGPANSYFRIGIDPTGATNPNGETVIWSKECWNVNNAGKWVDIAVSCEKQNALATVFVEYKVRRKGFSGCKYLTCLIDSVNVYSSNEPLIVSGNIKRVSEDWRQEYASLAVDSILKYVDGNNIVGQNTAAFWQANAWDIAGRSGKGAKILSNEVTPCANIDECALDYSLAVTNYKKGYGNSEDKMDAYHAMRDMVSEEQVVTPQSVPARFELARIDVRHLCPNLTKRILSEIPDYMLTPRESLEKCELLIKASRIVDGESLKSLAYEYYQKALEYGTPEQVAKAGLYILRYDHGRDPNSIKALNNVAENIAGVGVTDMRLAGLANESYCWTQHALGNLSDESTANSLVNIAEAYPDPHHAPCFLNVAFKYKSTNVDPRLGEHADAMQIMDMLVETYPEEFITTQTLQYCYERGYIR